MRYLGNKSNLVHFIDEVIQKYNIEGEIFADLFAGTCSVGDYFKDRYKIIANDYMKFSSIICKAKILNHQIPKFDDFTKLYKVNPFTWLNNRDMNREVIILYLKIIHLLGIGCILQKKTP